MTVAALWSVLDGSGTASAVGLQDWLPPTNSNTTSTAALRRQPPLRLAIDLSIWICEAQTSSVLRNFHSDPAVFLTYQRVVALRKMGLQLVAVIEGDRRGNGSSSRRGNGGSFAQACRSCEQMLTLCGVPVLRASHEAEALCALLNQRDVVDGVLSNDGDCLLFGASTVYTNFSLENLQRGTVMRYDASNLRAAVAVAAAAVETADDEDDEAATATCTGTATNISRSITLDRDDLIAFAILTGSDIAGSGVPNMGAKKAIKFIDSCRRSDASTRTALEVLRLWDSEARLAAATSTSAAAAEPDNAATIKQCSICLHPGNKRSHEKSGCVEYGTAAGEGCYEVSSEEREKLAVKSKVLAMRPAFASQPTIEAYRNPNGNAIPRTTTGATLSVSAGLPMQQPRYQDALRSSLLFKGTSQSFSQDYLRTTMLKLLARLYILAKAESTGPENRYASSSTNISDDVPTPRKIIGQKTKNGHPTYLIEWVIGKEEPLVFVTNEWQSIVDTKMSALVDTFRREEQDESRRAMFGRVGGRGAGGGGGNGGGGNNNGAGAKRRALVQGGQGRQGGGQGGRKGGGGKRERRFASTAIARDQDKDDSMPRHDEADNAVAAGDDVVNLTKYVAMQQKHALAEEEADGRDDERDDRNNGGKAGAGSDCSDLSCDDFDDELGGDNGTETKTRGLKHDGSPSDAPNHASTDEAAYETPDGQYYGGNLANPHSFKPFASDNQKDELQQEEIAAPAEQEQIGAAAAAPAGNKDDHNDGQPVLETPKVYFWGQLANPRTLPAKEPETDG